MYNYHVKKRFWFAIILFINVYSSFYSQEVVYTLAVRYTLDSALSGLVWLGSESLCLCHTLVKTVTNERTSTCNELSGFNL